MFDLLTLAVSRRRWVFRKENFGSELELYDPSLLSLQSNEYDEQLGEYEIKLKNVDLVHVRLCSKYLIQVTSDIIYLESVCKKLYLCCNEIETLPKEIGYLRNLTVLSLERNNVTYLPDTICMLTQLKELRLSFNRIYDLPTNLKNLKQLRVLTLAHNQYYSLPQFICSLQSLSYLDVSGNPLEYLPAELMRSPLHRFLAYACNFIQELPSLENLECFNDGEYLPSLMELSSRIIIDKSKSDDIKKRLPTKMLSYLSHSEICSYCGNSYLKWSIVRFGWWKRNEESIYPVKFSLCWRHWNTEEERLLAMFDGKTTFKASKSSVEPENTKCGVKSLPSMNAKIQRTLNYRCYLMKRSLKQNIQSLKLKALRFFKK